MGTRHRCERCVGMSSSTPAPQGFITVATVHTETPETDTPETQVTQAGSWALSAGSHAKQRNRWVKSRCCGWEG